MEEDIFDGIRVVIYKPSLERPTNNLLPGYVYYHGGGWTVGSVLIGHSIIKKLVEESKVVAILADYRMAPHVKFPVQFEDCLKATKYFMANAGRFGVDGHRIGVGGDSAGGNLAAAISLKLRDDKTFGFVPKVQVLVYPALQVIDLYTPSYQQTFDRTFMSREGMAWFWSMYITGSANLTKDIALGNHVPLDVKQRFAKSFLNHDDLDDQFKYLPYKKPELTEGDGEIWEKIKDVLNPFFAPLKEKNLSSLPKAFVYTVEYDVLRDEGLWYVQRLRSAGNDVQHLHGSTTFHCCCFCLKIIPDVLDHMNAIQRFLEKNL